jgi:hypothetical protein
MKDGAMNMWDLPSAVFIDSGLGISVDVDFQSGGEIWFPVPAATFDRLSNFTSQFIRSGLGVT